MIKIERSGLSGLVKLLHQYGVEVSGLPNMMLVKKLFVNDEEFDGVIPIGMFECKSWVITSIRRRQVELLLMESTNELVCFIQGEFYSCDYEDFKMIIQIMDDNSFISLIDAHELHEGIPDHIELDEEDINDFMVKIKEEYTIKDYLPEVNNVYHH